MGTLDEEASSTVVKADVDRTSAGVPREGWALGDRFSWAEIHQRLLAAASEEIASSPRELFVSALTAGFAIVVTFIGYAVGAAQFPNNPFLAALLYPLGFVYIIMGRYELYTENTLPPVKLVLTRLASLPLLLRLWGIVLAGNIAGAALGVSILANFQVLSPEAVKAGAGFASHGLALGWWDVFFKAIFAGWLVGGIVWLGIAARDSITRLVLVYVVFYLIAAADLFHVVTAGAEALFVVFLGQGPGLGALTVDFWLPVLLGNTIGGVVLVALAAYTQAEERRFPEIRELSTRELFFSLRGGRSFRLPRPELPEDQRQAEASDDGE